MVPKFKLNTSNSERPEKAFINFNTDICKVLLGQKYLYFNEK